MTDVEKKLKKRKVFRNKYKLRQKPNDFELTLSTKNGIMYYILLCAEKHKKMT